MDVNNALVSAILTGYAGFTTAAGYMGPKYRVDHDNSMLVPEMWCRMRVFEREPRFLIDNGYLEKVEDFEFEGAQVRASRWGTASPRRSWTGSSAGFSRCREACSRRRCCVRKSRT